MKFHPKITRLPENATAQQTRIAELETELALIKEIGESISAELDIEELLPIIARKAHDLVKADTLVIPILNKQQSHYVYEAAFGTNSDLIQGMEFQIHVGMCGWVLVNEKPLIFGKDVEWEIDRKTVWEEGRESAILVPLVARGNIIGGLSALGKQGGESFTQQDLELLSLFASQISIAIDNAHIVEEINDIQAQLIDQAAKSTLDKERAIVTLNAIGEGVVTTNTQRIILTMNPVAEYILGIQEQDTIGLSIDEVFTLLDGITRRKINNPVSDAIRNNSMVRITDNTLMILKDGQKLSVELTASIIRDSCSKSYGAVLVFRDVTEQQLLSRQISYQSSHDALTDLFNRNEFDIQLDDMIQRTNTINDHHALLYLDLDQFKIVNDTCGHVAGDELLRQATTILKEEIRGNDVLARLGGDEFGVLLENCTMNRAKRIANNMRSALRNFQFSWEDQIFRIGTSIGIVAINESSGSLHDVMSHADHACFVAKDKGRNRVNIYTPDDNELAQRHGEMQWISRIHKALNENKFVLYAQEIRNITGKHVDTPHNEILVRMIGDDNETIPPGAFIPAAERYDLMSDVDLWIFTTLLENMSKNDNTCYSVNVSGQSVANHLFLDSVIDLFKQSSIDPSRICIEITETSAIADLSNAKNFIKKLKSLGCLFALDDFGSGLSSFAYLKTLDVDFLKIDGMFVKDMVDDEIDCAMVEAIHKVGSIMGLKTVAEFVENELILQKLIDIGVHYAQGYGISRPDEWIP